MADKVFDKIQLGKESVVGSAVAADFVFPGKAAEPELDRGYLNPDEDFGTMSESLPGRGSWGVRQASTSIETPVRFEDVLHLFEMHLETAEAPTGANPYVYTHLADETSYTNATYTMELGSDDASDQWQLNGCVVPELTLGFDALTAPGNAPWMAQASVLAFNRSISAMTAGQSAPATLETAEGHLTQLFEGPVATAFDSLVELSASLVSFSLTSTRPYAGRVYGGTNDYATAWGLSGKASATFEAGIKIGSTAKSDIHDIFNVTGGAVTDRRWRIRCNGTSLATQNEVQTVTLTGGPTGGTFTLTFDGATTTALAYNIAAADLQVALRALPTVNGANCTVSGSAGGPYTVTFMGAKASAAQTLMMSNGALLTGAGSPYTVTIERTQAGGLLKSIVIDGRVRFSNVVRGDRDGESIYIVQGAFVKDATTGSRLKIVTTNGVSTIA